MQVFFCSSERIAGGFMKVVQTMVRKINSLGKKGQSATEYMLVLAVIVLGLVSAASHFIPQFNAAVASLGQNVSGWLSTNQEMSNPN